jgi:hypothetical protein
VLLIAFSLLLNGRFSFYFPLGVLIALAFYFCPFSQRESSVSLVRLQMQSMLTANGREAAT